MNSLQRIENRGSTSISIALGPQKVPAQHHSNTDCVEPVMTVAEAARILRWSYDSGRRYFRDLPGVLVKFQPKRYKRPYKHYMIPKSVFQREWDKMATFNAERKAA